MMARTLATVMMVGLCASLVPAAPTAPPENDKTPRRLVYQNPSAVSPKVRVDGHVRATEDAVLTLTVLAPERVGLTTKDQPSLYWFQSKPTTNRYELVITEKNAEKPLVEARFKTAAGGVQRAGLADFGVRLAEGVEYRWSVAIVLDPDNRSRDVVASGAIKRISSPEKLRQRLRGAPSTELPYIYADEGVWYDSLEALCALVDARPKDAKLHEIRAVYFMQVGLHDAALYDMQAAGRTSANPPR